MNTKEEDLIVVRKSSLDEIMFGKDYLNLPTVNLTKLAEKNKNLTNSCKTCPIDYCFECVSSVYIQAIDDLIAEVEKEGK